MGNNSWSSNKEHKEMWRDKNYAGLSSFFPPVCVCLLNSRVLHNKVSTFVSVEARAGPSTKILPVAGMPAD
jgi:hypothetical protein